jgi:outer membrane receptor protein involved in Fe transport
VKLTPDDVTGDLRLRLALTRDLQLLANVGRGFRPPNIFDLGTLGPRPGNRFNVANPRLAPETVWSYDLGLRAWGERWQVELFLFHLDYRDKIASVPTGDITDTGRVVVRSENRAEASVSGLELAVTWSMTGTLEFDAVLNISEGDERVEGFPETPGDRIPPLNGRLGLRWAATPRWAFDTWAMFAGEQDRLSPRDRLDPRIDPNGTPGWVTLNARARWQINAALALGLQLTNLLDEDYREHGSGIDAAGFGVGAWIDVAF